MDAATLAARLRASESPVVWRVAATGCRLARRVSRHRSRWSSRLGYALERLDTAREASREAAADRAWSAGRVRGPAAAHLRLARKRERAGDWSGAASAYRRALALDETHPSWWHRLGWCLLRGGDPTAAAGATRTACDLDGTHPRWFGLLGEAEAAAGNLAAATVARARAVDLAGAANPLWRLKLAELYDTVGQWDEAQRLLNANTEQHPLHAASHRMLGEVSLKLAYWGGSFHGTLPGRSAGTFRFERPFGADAALARRALERAAQLEPAKATWRAALAEARLADGDPEGAITLLTSALRDAQESTGRWVLAVKQRWQFELESIHHRLGAPRVEDPLFECSAEPGDPVAGDDHIPGLFSVRTNFAGIAVTGILAAADCDQVEILLDGAPLRAIKVGGDRFFPEFKLEIKRATLTSFPKQGQVEVCTPGGARLRAPGGADRLHLSIPHGSGDIADILAAGGKLDKKGVISPSPQETALRQERYLQIYDTVRDFFERELGRPLFLMYGTLLGYYRDGDFIPGDDDFDAGYVSDETDPVAVKEETKRIIVKLVKAGFTVSFNRRGRLFRVQLEREATDGFHLDLRPVWFQEGRVWVHNHCSFPSRREDFLPVVEGELRGVRVAAPRDTEAFLRGHYGPGWKVPDPGFMYYTSEIDPAILDNLGRALITVREYKELAERIRREVGDSPEAGRFVSVGSQDLYPLDEFLA